MFPQSAQQVTAGSMPVVPTSPAGDHAVLVLDDSAAQRQLLCALLDRWGMRPIASGDPEEALQIAETAGVGLVICDWMMPQMTGPEFCRRLRRAEREDYAYVILLTSKSADEALSEGLASGADDFLTKPLRPTELRARLQAGARTVAMQRELVDKNRRLGDALTELRGLYDAIDADLDEARRLQHSFLQDAVAQVKGAEISLWLESSGHVGGDMVGYFEADRSMVGIHSIDVAGHGVASAMIGARVAAMLSGAAPDQNIALSPLGAGIFRALPPDLVAARLNSLMHKELTGDRYLTLALALLDVGTGAVSFVQAGHPHPILLRRSGATEVLGQGGLPIGLLQEASFDICKMWMRPGDRLILYTDGLTECTDPDGTMLDEPGLLAICDRHRHRAGPEFLQRLKQDLVGFSRAEEFSDDASAIVLDYKGPPA